MKELPIEITTRTKIFIHLCCILGGLTILEDYKLVLELSDMDKIVYYPTIEELAASTSTFNAGDIRSLKENLENRWKNREVLCFYSAFLSPGVINPITLVTSRKLLIRGKFVKVPDDFVLRPIIDRDKQIDIILDDKT